jgi:hypothetical protein
MVERNPAEVLLFSDRHAETRVAGAKNRPKNAMARNDVTILLFDYAFSPARRAGQAGQRQHIGTTPLHKPFLLRLPPPLAQPAVERVVIVPKATTAPASCQYISEKTVEKLFVFFP